MYKEQIAVLLNRLEKITCDLETDRYCFESAKIVIEATKLHWEIIKYIEQHEVEISPKEIFVTLKDLK